MRKKVFFFILFLILIIFFSSSSLYNAYIDYKFKNIAFRPEVVQFDIEKVEKYVLDGNVVIVNFGNKNCIRCKVTDINLFSKPEVQNFLIDNDIIYMTIDVKNLSQEEADFAKENNISALPAFYVTSRANLAGKIYGGKVFQKDEFLEILKMELKNVNADLS